MQCTAIFLREWIFFKRKWISISLSALTAPALYLTAFGWGLDGAVMVEGMSYSAFLVPGLVAMNSMTSGFTAIATDINLSRMYQKTFEAVMIAPIKMGVYTLARIAANIFRAFYCSMLILIAAFFFGAAPPIDWYFIVVLLLNCAVFSAAGFLAGIVIESHADISKVSTFVIMPMSFLCGTVFSLEKFPPVLRVIVKFLPLSQTTQALRAGFTAANSFAPLLILAAWFTALLIPSLLFCKKAE